MKNMKIRNKKRYLISNQIILLFSLYLLSASQVFANVKPSIERELSSLFVRAKLAPATDERLFCSVPKQKYKSNYPHADYLLNIAEAEHLVIFVHGFIPDKFGGEHSFDGLVDVWQHHINIAKKVDNTAYCVVTWNTEYGHDDERNTLTYFLYAYYLATSNIRKSIRYQKPTLTIVGHSAGGNYIKYSYLFAKSAFEEVNKKLKRGLYINAETRIVTLGTPHLGTSFANDAAMYVFMGQAFAYLYESKGLARGLSGFGKKAYSRGANLLKPVSKNPKLKELNYYFSKIFPKKDLFAVGSNIDNYVDKASATPYFSTPFTLNVSHEDFLKPKVRSNFYRFLETLYKGGRP